jgi:glutamyl-tRNA synthetase
MSTRLRFAPSPTGLLHVGNARTALVNWLFTRKTHGAFILRFDDTDLERSKEEYKEAILKDMEWLNLTIDESFKQSDRLSRYQEAIQKLETDERLYPCYETPEELEFKRRRLRAQGKPPIYDRAALKLTEAEKRKLEDDGRKPHWRFLLKSGTVSWQDMCHGLLEFDAENLSDPILVREDQSPVYTLSSVVDDIDTHISHIMRGDDHITNTAIQIQLFEALGKDSTSITFGHLPLITGEQGESLSKRLGSLSLQSLREEGVEPLAIMTYLAKLGTSDEMLPCLSLQELIESFDFSKFGQSSPKFSLEGIYRLNEKLLHILPFENAASQLQTMGLSNITQDFWQQMQKNLTKLKDIKDLWEICHGSIQPVIEDKEFIKTATELLPVEPWNEDTWKEWTNAVKQRTNKNGKDLFMPLRKALTGESHGPEMKTLLPCIGREKSLKRLTHSS